VAPQEIPTQVGQALAEDSGPGLWQVASSVTCLETTEIITTPPHTTPAGAGTPPGLLLAGLAPELDIVQGSVAWVMLQPAQALARLQDLGEQKGDSYILRSL
jgi:hypothetical protein